MASSSATDAVWPSRSPPVVAAWLTLVYVRGGSHLREAEAVPACSSFYPRLQALSVTQAPKYLQPLVSAWQDATTYAQRLLTQLLTGRPPDTVPLTQSGSDGALVDRWERAVDAFLRRYPFDALESFPSLSGAARFHRALERFAATARTVRTNGTLVVALERVGEGLLRGVAAARPTEAPTATVRVGRWTVGRGAVGERLRDAWITFDGRNTPLRRTDAIPYAQLTASLQPGADAEREDHGRGRDTRGHVPLSPHDTDVADAFRPDATRRPLQFPAWDTLAAMAGAPRARTTLAGLVLASQTAPPARARGGSEAHRRLAWLLEAVFPATLCAPLHPLPAGTAWTPQITTRLRRIAGRNGLARLQYETLAAALVHAVAARDPRGATRTVRVRQNLIHYGRTRAVEASYLLALPTLRQPWPRRGEPLESPFALAEEAVHDARRLLEASGRGEGHLLGTTSTANVPVPSAEATEVVPVQTDRLAPAWYGARFVAPHLGAAGLLAYGGSTPVRRLTVRLPRHRLGVFRGTRPVDGRLTTALLDVRRRPRRPARRVPSGPPLPPVARPRSDGSLLVTFDRAGATRRVFVAHEHSAMPRSDGDGDGDVDAVAEAVHRAVTTTGTSAALDVVLTDVAVLFFT